MSKKWCHEHNENESNLYKVVVSCLSVKAEITQQVDHAFVVNTENITGQKEVPIGESTLQRKKAGQKILKGLKILIKKKKKKTHYTAKTNVH